jgi:membrane protein implicated in regulation of membrane protease activity
MPQGKTGSTIWKAVKSFFSFWKDFLVGDSPVLALGVVIILAVAYLLRSYTYLAPATVIILVLALMTFTVWQKARKPRRNPQSQS